MGFLPYLRQKNAGDVVTYTFKGLNRMTETQDGEWNDDENISSREHPMLCPRKKRSIIGTLEKPNGIIGRAGKLYAVDGTKLLCDGDEVEGVTLTDSHKTFVSMGAYLLIFPDKYYVNTIDHSDHGSIENTFSGTMQVTCTMCRLDGSDYENVITSPDVPEDPVNGQYWIDTSSTPHKLMLYGEASGSWNHVLTTYVRLEAPGIGAGFNVDDNVTISGFHADAGETDEELKQSIEDLNGDHVIHGKNSDDAIVVVGYLDYAYQVTGNIELKRVVPDMEYIIENDNRLWGCHYGYADDGSVVNEIYASKLGDFKNWRVYDGLSTDSYAVSIGSDGPWTGAAAYNGYPTFFKENICHKVYGSYPANYQVMTTQLRGVGEDNGKSLAIVNGTLLYASRYGVEAFDGSMPQAIADELNTWLISCKAAAVGNRYYMACINTDNGKIELYVYDISKNVWHRESCKTAIDMTVCDGELYVLQGDGTIWCTDERRGTPEEQVVWTATSGILGWDMTDHKFYTRYNIRATMEAGSELEVWVRYDSKGMWQRKFHRKQYSRHNGSMIIPVIPHRCDHMELRICGKGDVRIFTISRVLSGGGDASHG